MWEWLIIFLVYLFFADAKVQTAGLSSSWLATFKCRHGSAVTLLGISKCRRGSADRGWLFLIADAKVQTLALSLSSLDCTHISSSDTFRFWNWALASSKTQSDQSEVTKLSMNDEDKIEDCYCFDSHTTAKLNQDFWQEPKLTMVLGPSQG